MAEAYAYTPEIWPPLAAGIVVAAIALFCWRRRNVPAAPPLAVCALFSALWLLGNALTAAAAAPATTIAWYRFQAACQLPAITAGTCFALEYTYPGRWLTRRNLALLAFPPLLAMLLMAANDGQAVWRRLEIAPDGSVLREFTPVGLVFVAYGLGLVILNATALIWLFVHSPQHRWPVALILFGQTVNRGLYLLGLVARPAPPLLENNAVVIILPWIAMYAIALFGFRIFDPVPAARKMAVEQMPDGMIVLYGHERVASLNPAAARMLSTSPTAARGKTLEELASACPDLAARVAGPDAGPVDVRLGAGDKTPCYALTSSPLHDFRGLPIGRLLVLRDVTEERRLQAQALEQQRTLAVLHERERLARELHDDLGQVLAFVSTQGQTVRRLLARGEVPAADEQVARLVDVARDADTDIRESILGLRVAFGERGLFPVLAAYLDQYAKRYGIHAEMSRAETLDDDAFEPAVEVQLLRIVQEALANARKHARAHSVWVTFEARDGRAQVTVRDDGAGFDPAQVSGEPAGHVGLRVMRERAEEIGGTLDVLSRQGEGTQVVVTVPVRT